MTTRRSQLQEDTNYRVLRMLQDNPDLPAKLNHRRPAHCEPCPHAMTHAKNRSSLT
jgi:hypothetical protein